jgi:sorting nexin-1/2
MREHLVRNWPGCYVPPIPPKKMTGNKDERFVEDRLVFLDRFMK